MKRILVIDDEPQMRSMLRRVLERAGYEVEDAPDGETGLEYFSREQADLVLADILMPGKEGLGTIQELRQLCPDVKIIAMSGGGWNRVFDYLSFAREFGADHVFRKPFDSKELVTVIRDLLEEAA